MSASSGEQELDTGRVIGEIRAALEDGSPELHVDVGLDRALEAAFGPPEGIGSLGRDLSALIMKLETLAQLDLDPPVDSGVPGGRRVKRIETRALRWYMQHLANQLAEFGAVLGLTLRTLVEQVGEAEALLDTGTLTEIHLPTPRPDHRPFLAAITTALTSAPDRVLVTECGHGSLLRALGDAGIAAYGIVEDDDSALVAFGDGVDVRTGRTLDHLRNLADGVLGGLVLWGSLDIVSLARKRALLAEANRVVRNGGTIVLVVHDPRSWPGSVDTITLDLAGGAPLHASTWVALLERLGMEVESVAGAPGSQGADSSSDPGATVDRAEPVVPHPAPPPAHCLIATKPT